jgi:hypothetical protein
MFRIGENGSMDIANMKFAQIAGSIVCNGRELHVKLRKSYEFQKEYVGRV